MRQKLLANNISYASKDHAEEPSSPGIKALSSTIPTTMVKCGTEAHGTEREEKVGYL